MDAFILVSWSEEGPMLADPATVGYAWRLDELDPLEDNDEPDFDRNAYEQGLRWCTSFSCVTPEGENGWLADENLLPLSQDELDHARLELGRGSVPFLAGAGCAVRTRGDARDLELARDPSLRGRRQETLDREFVGAAPRERGGEKHPPVSRRLSGSELVSVAAALPDDVERFAWLARVIVV
jgi:hypothetical protein